MTTQIVFATLPAGLNPMSLFDTLPQLGPTGQLPSSYLAGTLGCSQRQWRMALSTAGYLNTVANSIPPDLNNPINAQWSCGLLVETGDALWNATADALGGLTPAQMAVILAAAQLLPF